MRLGLLSTARINDAILAAAAESDRVDVVAVASRDGERARLYADEHGIARAHGSYEALLEDSDVDAIYVSLPNALHHEWTMSALEAGKHVLCEKPYSRDPADVEQAFATARSAGLVLMEAFMYRHHPQTHAIAALVRDGALGKLLSVRSTFTFPLASLTDVRARPELAGGALMDVGCYCVSGSRLIAGEPVSVFGTETKGPNRDRHGVPRDDAIRRRRGRAVRGVLRRTAAAGARGGRRRGRAHGVRALAHRLARRATRDPRKWKRGRAGSERGRLRPRAREHGGCNRGRCPGPPRTATTLSARHARSTRSTAPPRAER